MALFTFIVLLVTLASTYDSNASSLSCVIAGLLYTTQVCFSGSVYLKLIVCASCRFSPFHFAFRVYIIGRFTSVSTTAVARVKHDYNNSFLPDFSFQFIEIWEEFIVNKMVLPTISSAVNLISRLKTSVITNKRLVEISVFIAIHILNELPMT